MILVLLGTQNNSFHRLLEEIEKNIENGNITEEVVVQAGYTKFEPSTKKQQIKIFNTVPKDELEKMIEKANIVISHGGVGSMITANQKGKKVIAVPRMHEYGEHVNNHQKEIVKDFNDKGYIIGIEKVEDLKHAIIVAKKFEPKKYQHNNKKMLKIIEEFIDKI